MKFIKKHASYAGIFIIAILAALNYIIFVFPNKFAPAGIDGICTIIQDTAGINIGYLSLLFNIPLIVIAFFYLNRDFAIKSTFYVIVFSVASIFFKVVDISSLYFVTQNGSSTVLAPIVAGTIRGILYAFSIRLNGSSAGIDIIASIVKKRKPYFNLMNIIFCINLFVSFSSYFFYGMRWEPVVCGILYCFITSNVSNHIRAGQRQAIKYEIITSSSELLCEMITTKLNQTATVVDAKGVYSGGNRKMVICVTDKRNAPYLEEFILNNPSAVVFKSVVDNSIVGIDYK